MTSEDPVFKILKEHKKIIELFYAEVCSIAEQKMLITGKLEGAHYAAMRQLIEKLRSDKIDE